MNGSRLNLNVVVAADCSAIPHGMAEIRVFAASLTIILSLSILVAGSATGEDKVNSSSRSDLASRALKACAPEDVNCAARRQKTCDPNHSGVSDK